MFKGLSPGLQEKLDGMDEQARSQYLSNLLNLAYEMHCKFNDIPAVGEQAESSEGLDEESEDMLLGGLEL